MLNVGDAASLRQLSMANEHYEFSMRLPHAIPHSGYRNMLLLLRSEFARVTLQWPGLYPPKNSVKDRLSSSIPILGIVEIDFHDFCRLSPVHCVTDNIIGHR